MLVMTFLEAARRPIHDAEAFIGKTREDVAAQFGRPVLVFSYPTALPLGLDAEDRTHWDRYHDETVVTVLMYWDGTRFNLSGGGTVIGVTPSDPIGKAIGRQPGEDLDFRQEFGDSRDRILNHEKDIDEEDTNDADNSGDIIPGTGYFICP